MTSCKSYCISQFNTLHTFFFSFKLNSIFGNNIGKYCHFFVIKLVVRHVFLFTQKRKKAPLPFLNSKKIDQTLQVQRKSTR